MDGWMDGKSVYHETTVEPNVNSAAVVL